MSDFNYIPAQGSELVTTPRARRADYGDGYIQRVADGINNQPATWNLVFNRSEAECDAIEAQLAGYGAVDAFTWTPPGNKNEITVICSSWKRGYPNNRTVSGITATFEQVFDIGTGISALSAGSIARVTEGDNTATLTSTLAASGGIVPRAYQWERKTTGSFADVTGATSATLADTGLSPATAYTYRRRVYDSAGDFVYSNEVVITTTGTDPAIWSFDFITTPTLEQSGQTLLSTRVDSPDRIRAFRDYEGLTRYAVSLEAVFEGYRRVENLWPGFSDPPVDQTVTVVVGRSYVLSFTGTGTVSWSGAATGSLVGQGVSTRVGAIPLTATTTSLVCTLTGTVTFIQVEDVTGNILNSAPSEYVSRGTLSIPYHGAGVDAVKYFTTTNGNTLIAGVVTATSSSSISTTTLRGLSIFPEQTNVVLHSEDFATTWSNVGSPTLTANTDACGLVKLSTLNDTSSSVLQGKTQTITGFWDTVTTKGVKFFFKKGTSASSLVRVRDTTVSGDIFSAVISWPGSLQVVTRLGGGGIKSSSSATASGSITVPVGCTLLVAAIAYSTRSDHTQKTVSSVSWNGSTAGWSAISGAAGWTGTTGDEGGCDLWYVINPTAATASLVTTLNAAPDTLWVSWTTYSGSDTTAPFATASTSTDTAGSETLAQVLGAGDMAVDCMYSGYTNPTDGVPTGGDTLVYRDRDTGGRSGGSQTNNSDGNMDWVGLRSGHNYACAATIIAGSIAGGGSVPRITMISGAIDRVDTMGNGCFEFWGRTTTLTNIADTHTIDIFPATNSSLITTATGTFLIGGVNVQVSEHAYPGPVPYIPTGGTATLRTFDQILQNTIPWYNATEGTMVVTVEYDISSGVTTADAQYAWQIGSSGLDRIIMTRRMQGGVPNVMCPLMRNGGTEQVLSGDLGVLDNSVIYRVAYGWKTNNLGFSVNGHAVVTDTSANIPVISTSDQFGFGGSPGFGSTDGNTSGAIRGMTYFNVKKTSSELRTLSHYP